MNKTTIKKEIERENSVEPKIVDKDNGTQTFEDSEMQKVNHPKVVQGAATMDNVEVPTDQVRVDYIETPVVMREKRIIDESLDANKLKTIINDYKTKNPKKYEAKKEELERKLKEAGKDK